MAHDVRVVADKLVRFLDVIIDPQADQLQRQEAYQVGLLLSVKAVSPIVRHFGLQLIEHCIKFHWNNMHQDERVFIKGKALELLESILNTLYVPEVHSRINPGYASVTDIVESYKNNILGMNQTNPVHIAHKTTEERLQDFITSLHERKLLSCSGKCSSTFRFGFLYGS